MNKGFLTSVVIFCLAPCWLQAQKVEKFVYGGSNGKKFNGTATVRYYAQDQRRKVALENVVDTIDLNNLNGAVRFIAEVGQLQLGLTNSYDAVKNSNHPKAFYLEMVRLQTIPKESVAPVGLDTVKISAEGGHFGENIDQISFEIRDLKEEITLLFRFGLGIRDGIYDREWEGPIVSKRVILLPKIVEVIDSVNTDVAAISNKQQGVAYRPNYTSNYKPQVETDHQEVETIEDRLWEKIQTDLISDNRIRLLKNCRIYKMNCDQHVFTECEYTEDVLYFMASLSAEDEKPEFISDYVKNYPSGKYIDRMDELIAPPKVNIIPIKEGMAKLDYDQKTLLANRVEGGNKPYHIGFYDYSKSKDYAVKNIGFNRENISINLSELEIAEGSYTVKVRDSVGQIFVEKGGIYISNDISMPNSVKLVAIVALIGIVGLLYKRYIYF